MDQAMAPPSQEPPRKPEQTPEPTILLVEDHFMTRWTAAEYLRQNGFKVLEAVDVTEALGLAGSGVQIDALFTDIQLRGENGNALARWFIRHRPQTPILATSANEENDTLPRSGLHRFVRKPYDLELVVPLLRSMLQSHWR